MVSDSQWTTEIVQDERSNAFGWLCRSLFAFLLMHVSLPVLPETFVAL